MIVLPPVISETTLYRQERLTRHGIGPAAKATETKARHLRCFVRLQPCLRIQPGEDARALPTAVFYDVRRSTQYGSSRLGRRGPEGYFREKQPSAAEAKHAFARRSGRSQLCAGGPVIRIG